MIETLHAMTAELRRMRVPVTTSDLISATEALTVVDLEDRDQVREALASCLAKSRDYRDTFEVLFGLYFSERTGDDERSLAGLEDADLRTLLVHALARGNRPLLREIAAEAVDRHARIQPGRAVAGTYYIFRTLRGVDADTLGVAVEGEDPVDDGPGSTSVIARAMRERHALDAVADFERIVESEVRRRLVAERGADDVAVALRSPLPEDEDFLTASLATIERMAQIVEPLGRALGRQLADRQKSAARRRLDIRGTIRESLSTGGAPVTLRYLPPQPPKPRLLVLADISGSVASFASFALQLTYALRGHFSSLRSFVFVDGVDEVTDLVGKTRTITETTSRINAERRGIWLDGHSDYGNAFAGFVENHLTELDQRTTVLILGDARNNYRDPRFDALDTLRAHAADVYWLNPERRSLWTDGDSEMARYADHCDLAVECRTIRQLQAFVATLG